MSPLHRIRHLSRLMLSKDEFFNDLQMNHSGRIIREARALSFLKTKRETVPSTEKACKNVLCKRCATRREGCCKTDPS